jgi:hypothetical protein
MAQFKDRLKLVEEAVHSVLSPIGFKKQKTNWRRSLPEVLQQFTIASMQTGTRYRPEWGLNLFAYSENPKPVHNELQVSWMLEDFICPFIVDRLVGPLDEVLAVKRAFDLAHEFSNEERTAIIETFLKKRVIPCFDMYQTQDSVRKMMGKYRAPLRAQVFVGLPDDWRPPE